MAAVTVNTDLKLVVTGSTMQGPLTGSRSAYVNNIHPGSGLTINGWEYDNRMWPADDSDYTSSITGLTNPDLSKVPSSDYQAGVGSGDACTVEDLTNILISGFIENWIPEIEHGKWYDQDREYYLFSDQVRSEYPIVANTVSGCGYVDLAEFPKDAVPILARTYRWDSTVEKYLVYKNYIKKVYFTGSKLTPTGPRQSTWNADSQSIIFGNIDPSFDEFVLQWSDVGNPPRAIFNKDVIGLIGVTVVSGPTLLQSEDAGLSDGSDRQYFHSKYSPVDKTAAIEIFTYTTDPAVRQAWTIVPAFTHTGHQVMFDYDLGIAQFGTAVDGDAIPAATAHIMLHYNYTADLSYETSDSQGIHTAFNTNADCNPMTRTNNRGFIVIDRTELIPATIELAADTTEISLDTFGPINIGNILLPLKATVSSKSGMPIEHAKVTFELLDSPLIGHFTNGTASISSYSNNNGTATSYYDTPNSLDDVSEFIPIAGYSTSGGNTILTTTTLKMTPTLRDVFIYSVWNDDFTQGIDIGSNTTLQAGLMTTQLSDYYKAFFTAEGIYGPTGLDPGTGNPEGLLQSGASWWENRRRILEVLLTPTSYNRALRNGRKQIITTWSSSGLDPHYQETGALVPLTPSSITNVTGRTYHTQYNGVVLTAPGTGNLDGYLLISPASVLVRAKTVDAFSNKTIYSNTITIKLQVGDALNGTVYIDDINAVPAAIVPYVLNGGDNGKILPLGFKIRQTGVTLASAVQRVTYIDINPQAIITMTFNVDKLI